MTFAAWTLICAAAGLVLYAYVGYPLALQLLAWRRRAPRAHMPEESWPPITITVPAYNEEAQIRGVIESLLAIDYPRDRTQILVVSDASTDRTDEIVREYADRGVELLRLPRRAGKTAAENAARALIRGDIVINTDASIRIDPGAVKRLVAAFADPEVGVASGRDVSVSRMDADANTGEASYVGYEMWVRSLETRVSGIVGASGCLYAIRADLHDHILPEALSRDFASAMVARENGYRAVSVDEALCYVPRTSDLQREFRRKVRTVTRGIETLFFKGHLLNPFRYGVFSWMLFSHKICRWLVPWALAAAAAGIAMLAVSEPLARIGVLAMGLAAAAAAIAYRWPPARTMPRPLAIAGYLVLGNLAVLKASINALRGELNPVWEPTRREAVAAE